MKKKNYSTKLSIFVLAALLVSVLGVNSYYIYTIKNQVATYFQTDKKIERLQTLDREFNRGMSSYMSFLNYDASLRDTKEFETLIEELKNSSSVAEFLQEIQGKNAFILVEEGYRKKKELILKFSSYNSIINNSVRYCSKLYDDVDKKEVAQIYIKLLHMGLGLEDEKGAIKAAIDTQRAAKNLTETDTIFLAHLANILKYNTLLSENLKRSADLQLSEKIENLAKLYFDFYNKNINLLYDVFYVMFFMLSLLMAVISVLLYKKIRSEHALHQFKQAIQNSDNSVILTDKSHKIEYVNDTFLHVSGFDRYEVLGHTPKVFQSGLHTKEFYEDLAKKIHNGKVWSGEFINKSKDGNLLYEKATIVPIRDDDGEITNYLAIKLDVTQDRSYQKMIEEQKNELEMHHFKDELTQLENLNALIRDMSIYKKGVIVYINIDAFSHIKYFYGLLNGDNIIKEFAKYLDRGRERFGIERVYRIKGDEFALLKKESTDKFSDFNVLMEFHRYCEDFTHQIEDQIITFSVSTGVSLDKDVVTDGVMFDRYIQAELAHKESKRDKKKIAIFDFNGSIQKEYKHNLLISKKVSSAVKEDRIYALYQPVYDSGSKKISYYEALVRIIDTDGTMLTPDIFLDIAKRSSLYHDITQRMLSHVFEVIKEKGITVSVNLTTYDFESKCTLNMIMDFIQNKKFAECLIFEIVESESIENFSTVVKFIEDVKKMGCKIAIDDFGSGYSNYARVSKLNIDYIKIDGSLIHDIDENTKNKAIVESIVLFAKNMNFHLVAEFVKSEKIYDTIKDMGIGYAQGYYLSEPKIYIEHKD